MRSSKSMGQRSASTGIVVARKEDVALDAPAHVTGVVQGNWPSAVHRKRVDEGIDETVTGEPQRSTGILAAAHGPIDPRMPKLSPP
ncbi:MAG: hypothetical protein JWO86_2362 [Myxococcaceae bacterium]|nr:hypothetical protein [Myxococcaceae bacterium]